MDCSKKECDVYEYCSKQVTYDRANKCGLFEPLKANKEPAFEVPCSDRVICAAITEFFESMISELSGTDDGCNVTLDDYTIEKGLRPYFDYYIKNKINI